jgi:trimethylamine-N-oxide reductase (cytochrome c)
MFEVLPPKQFIPRDLIHDALLNPPISWYGYTWGTFGTADQFREFHYPIPEAEGGSDIHMMWTDAPCWITCWNDSNSFIKATRSPKIECIVAQQPWFENDCLFADIVLPITTKFENNDIGADSGNGQFPIITDEKRVIGGLPDRGETGTTRGVHRRPDDRGEEGIGP